MIGLQCSDCHEFFSITERKWLNDSFAPCPNGCPDGGSDLIHARRHMSLDD